MTDFIAFALANGLAIQHLDTSGKIKRCPTVEHPRSKNGAYAFDGERGFVWAWDGEGRAIPFSATNREWTGQDKAAWVERRNAARVTQEAEWKRAAQRAAEMLRSTRPGIHGYLMRKGLPDALGLCLPDGALFIPMRSLTTNELRGGQVIRWLTDERKWDKKMVPGMRAKGAVLRLGSNKAPETVLCEGHATGLSIEMAARQMRLNLSVLVCFSDSNMAHVAPLISERAFVFADNDASGAGERAAKAAGLPYCMSPTVGQDANDWHMASGLLPVSAALMNVRRELAVT